MALIEAIPPSEPLFHIGRNPDPFAWAEWQFVGAGRFDDPKRPRSFRVLYAAEQRLASFVETLQKWRPSIEALAALDEVIPAKGGGDVPEDLAGLVPTDWHLKRSIGTLRLLPDQRWIDLREHETRETLRVRLASTLQKLGVDDFDLSDALSRNRRLTQSVARFAFEEGFQGITYKSRFDNNFDCWAMFEGARFEPMGRFAIMRNDPDFVEAARRFGLRTP
jgi:hypothetical protein